MPDPIFCFSEPVSMLRSGDVPLVLKYPGLSGQPHKLNCRDGVVQDDAGALHTVTAGLFAQSRSAQSMKPLPLSSMPFEHSAFVFSGPEPTLISPSGGPNEVDGFERSALPSSPPWFEHAGSMEIASTKIVTDSLCSRRVFM